MWVYDGEDWTDDSSDRTQPETPQRPRYDEMMPELQVIEITQVPTPRPAHITPFPLP
jgi:hypothetical protein